MLRASIFVATCLLAGCPTSRPEAPHAPDDAALRVRIAQAEARRTGGVDELAQLATSGDAHARELALRGLGRIGSERAMSIIERALGDDDPRVVAAAMSAIGVATALDEPKPDAATRLEALIVPVIDAPAAPRARPRGDAEQRAIELAGLEALGRAGGAGAQVRLSRGVASPDPAIAERAAIALGRHGRRKLALGQPAREALVAATRSADASVRYAATYALSREHEPAADEAVNAALTARITDEQPETRATAIAGLARRKALASARDAIERALRDPDWRVAVEAVRALSGATGDDAGRATVAAALAQHVAELARGNAAEAHVVLEGLHGLVNHPIHDPASSAHLVQLIAAANSSSVPVLAKGWIDCLGKAATIDTALSATQPGASVVALTAAGIDSITSCGDGGLPDHLRLPLLADLVNAGVGDASFRRAAIRVLLAHDDPRVRAAGLSILPATWQDGDARAQATIVGTVTSAMAVKDPIVAGTAVDVAGTLYDTMGADHPLRATLDAAVLARARAETDIELASSLYALVGKRAIAGGAEACRAGLSGPPARAKAAADCLRALGEAAAQPPAAEVAPPPGDVAAVIGNRPRWHLVTTRGEIVIELRPDVAPWAVASIVALTRRGFYNGLEFHRVVPDFVVQGGDPTESGWGGPGYTLPAEPASSADAAGYVAGGVGIADAGRDSGGSQWFIMHARAPHLDGRYTWIGSVVSGQKSADALLIGDRVEKATIENPIEQP